jgi:Tat protein translocase TatB subunit
MFEVGFTEIVLIMGLALLVLGPEKLPGLAQKIGRWTGRARAMARQLRTQLEQEVTLEEISRSRPMQAPPPPPPETGSEPAPSTTASDAYTSADAPDTAHTAADTAAGPDAAASHEPPSDKPHNESGLDVHTMISGMEPPPQSSAEAPATKAVP